MSTQPSTNPTYNPAQLLSDLTADEAKRLKPYRDTVGKISIGIGRNLTDNGISEAEMMVLFQNDVDDVLYDLDQNIPWWRTKPENIQRCLINLCFNMGWSRFSQFVTFLNRIQIDDYQDAANDLKTTAWFHQVGLRGPRMLARLTEGLQPPSSNA